MARASCAALLAALAAWAVAPAAGAHARAPPLPPRWPPRPAPGPSTPEEAAYLADRPLNATGFRYDVRRSGMAPRGTRFGGSYRLRWWSEETMVSDYYASRSQPVITDELVIWGADNEYPVVWAYNRTSGEPVWTYTGPYETSHGIHGTAWVEGERLWVGDYGGHVHCLHVRNGSRIWLTKLHDYIGSSPVVYKGFVFVTIETKEANGWVAILNATSGAVVWRSKLIGGHPHSSPGIDPVHNYACTGCNSGRITCIDFNSLLPVRERAEHALCGLKGSDPQLSLLRGDGSGSGNAAANASASAASDDEDGPEGAENTSSSSSSSSAAVDTDGSTQATAPRTTTSGGVPCRARRRPFVAWTYETRVDAEKTRLPPVDPSIASIDPTWPVITYAINSTQIRSIGTRVDLKSHPAEEVEPDAEDGTAADLGLPPGRPSASLDKPRAQLEEEEETLRGAAIKSTVNFHPSKPLMFVSSWNQRLYAFHSGTGAPVWQHVLGGMSMSSPAIDPIRDVVVVGSADFHIHGVNASTGAPLWKTPVRGDVLSSPIVIVEPHHGTAVVGAGDGIVYFIDSATGVIRLRMMMPAMITNPPMAVGDEVYVLDHLGYLAAWEATWVG